MRYTFLPDGQALRDVDPQVMRPGQRGDELKRTRTETPDDPFGASDEDILIPDSHAIGAARLQKRTEIDRHHSFSRARKSFQIVDRLRSLTSASVNRHVWVCKCVCMCGEAE